MGLFSKKKQLDALQKVEFNVGNNNMVHVKCPYCREEIDSVIVHLLDKSKYTACPYCGRTFG